MAGTTGLTLFSWGYRNWGNATDKFVEAVDALERSRGWGPPLFVDIRASRKVRAVGFNETTFERRFGSERYRWLQGLGNKAILEGGGEWELIDPSAAGELLRLADEMGANERRVIFFCACLSPAVNCHRHLVAPELKRFPEARHRAVTIVEWPGFESEPETPPLVKIDEKTFRSLCGGGRWIPLGRDLPNVSWLGLPFYAVARFEAPARDGFLFTGPPRYRSGRWDLEFLGVEPSLQKARATSKRAREEYFLLPR